MELYNLIMCTKEANPGLSYTTEKLVKEIIYIVWNGDIRCNMTHSSSLIWKLTLYYCFLISNCLPGLVVQTMHFKKTFEIYK